MLNSSHWKLTRSWQKDFCITETVIKIDMDCERREERLSSWDLCLWEESQKKRQITHVEICPGEWTIQATYWVTQSWDPTEGRGAPLAGWRPDGINNREACTSLLKNTWELTCCWGRASFPGGSVGKESACNVGDPGSCSGWGRSPGEGISNPLQYSCLENSMDRGAWLSYNPWDHELSDTWVTSTLTFWGRAERDGLSTAQVAVTSRYYLWHFCCW